LQDIIVKLLLQSKKKPSGFQEKNFVLGKSKMGILKHRKRRPEGVNGSRKISRETFGRYPKITTKHAKQTP
jgi:hypothetical protein